jgi:hypothetical protein
MNREDGGPRATRLFWILRVLRFLQPQRGGMFEELPTKRIASPKRRG